MGEVTITSPFPLIHVIMINFTAKAFQYTIIKQSSPFQNIFPYFIDHDGQHNLWLVSPQHGRSYVVSHHANRWIISKGNGLSYTQKAYIQSKEQSEDVWGLLIRKDAIRDFSLGNEIADLGIRTNKMEAVIELDKSITIDGKNYLKPVLLQYSVECPYRISDAAFMPKHLIEHYVKNWIRLDLWKCDAKYKIAANLLISNLRILHDHHILHNALTSQNLTWALELLDFELAQSPQIPYDNDDYNRHVPDLFEREILHIYQIILDIAWILRERPDYEYLDHLFKCYGFLL